MINKKRNFLHENWKFNTIPNILTFGRMLAVPFLVLSFFIKESVGNFLTLFIFISASLTDYFDGYIARRFKLTSKLGTFLDPLADKLLISVALLLLAGFGKISSYNLIPASIIICRELIISGLREFLGAIRLELPVLQLAKYKTTVQMIAIACLLYNFKGQYAQFIILTGNILLWIACLLTIITGITYIFSGITFIKMRQLEKCSVIPRRRRKRKEKNTRLPS
jgi:cardiolipin synthase